MSTQRFLNNWRTVLTAPVVAIDTTIEIAAPEAAKLVGASQDNYYLLTLTTPLPETKWEVVKAIGVSGTTVTVERAQEDINGAAGVAETWSTDDVVDHRVTAETMRFAHDHLASFDAILTDGTNVLVDHNGNILTE